MMYLPQCVGKDALRCLESVQRLNPADVLIYNSSQLETEI